MLTNNTVNSHSGGTQRLHSARSPTLSWVPRALRNQDLTVPILQMQKLRLVRQGKVAVPWSHGQRQDGESHRVGLSSEPGCVQRGRGGFRSGQGPGSAAVGSQLVSLPSGASGPSVGSGSWLRVNTVRKMPCLGLGYP